MYVNERANKMPMEWKQTMHIHNVTTRWKALLNDSQSIKTLLRPQFN